MAENDSGQDRTEQATAKRLTEAREKGDVPRSRELNTFTTLIAALIGFMVMGRTSVLSYHKLAAHQWQIDRVDAYSDASILNGFYEPLVQALWIVAPFLALMFISTLIGPVFMGGWVFSLSSLKFDLSKVNPITGIKRVFSLKGLVELLKAVMKVLLLGGIAVTVLLGQADKFVDLGKMALSPALISAFSMLFNVSLMMALAMGLMTLVDVPYQRWSHAKKLRMTRQEVIKETKETSGNPEIKSKQRSIQQSVSQRRMLLDVPDADVIIVNPTHYSVALKYEEDKSAPRVVAKGVDLMALRIREIAKASDVPVFSAPPLSRALYRHAEIGDVIPAELYLAVAQVLAYIFQTNNLTATEQRGLQKPADLPVPHSMQDPE